MDISGVCKSLLMLFLALIISIASAQEISQHDKKVSNSCFLFPKYHIMVKNAMDDRSEIKVHCKSKDDDMGEHILEYDQFIRFSFRPLFTGNTFFWCDVFWMGKWVVFDAYDHHRDDGRCYTNHCSCPWYITQAGPCFASKWRCDGWRS